MRIGATDAAVTGCAGVLALSHLVDRLRVVQALDQTVGPIKQRDRGVSAGELVVAVAQAQLAGADFLSGLDRHRLDPAARVLSAVRVPASTTTGGLARRFTIDQVAAVESGWAQVIGTWWAQLSAGQQSRLRERVTIDVDATDIEVHGAKERTGYTYAGMRAGRAHPATWAETGVTLAGDLLSGTDDPRSHTPALLRRALAALPREVTVDRPDRAKVRVRQDSGYFSGDIARAAVEQGMDFAIAAKRIAPLWQASINVNTAAWRDIVMGKGKLTAQIAALDYAPAGWPEGTYTVVRRVWTPAEQISDSAKARRKRTFGPEQLAFDLGNTEQGKWAYSFIVTNIPAGGDGFDTLIELEQWFRGRADIENVIRDDKHGAALNHLPSGSHRVNTIWMWAAFIATSLTVMLQTLTADPGAPVARTLTVARTLITVPARIIRHARGIQIRPGPAAQHLPDLLTRLGVARI